MADTLAAAVCPDCTTPTLVLDADGDAVCTSCGNSIEDTLGLAGAVRRNGRGEPLIVPADGGKPKPYARASSVGKVLEDTYALSRWQQRMVLVGTVAAAGLVLEAETAVTNDDRSHLDAVVDKALLAAGANDRAKLGTLMHSVFEADSLGRPLPEFPAECARDLDAFRKATEGWIFIASERFVVNDELGAAGSFDWLAIVTLADGRRRLVVVDAKTGSSLKYAAMSYTIQQAIYVSGKLYDPATGARAELTSLLPDEYAAVELCTDTAILLHLPAGEGTCEVVEVPIEQGRAGAELAARVREARRVAASWLSPTGRFTAEEAVETAPAHTPVSIADNPADPVADAIAAAAAVDDLTAAWATYGPDGDGTWTNAHTELAKARRALIDGGLAAA